MFKKIKKSLIKGGGEILGFMAILPCLCFLLVFIVGAFQSGSIKERLEYTAYVACRAAISEKNYELADAAAKQAAQDDLTLSGEKNITNLKTELKIVGDGVTESTQKWMKGNMVQCIVTADVKNVSIFFPKTRMSTIIMMIENPSDEGDNYRWFRDYENGGNAFAKY